MNIYSTMDEAEAASVVGTREQGNGQPASVDQLHGPIDDHADLLALLDRPRPGNLRALLALQRAFSRKDEQR
jgi:hypothetical protein